MVDDGNLRKATDMKKHKATTHASTPGRMEYCTCSRCGQRCGSGEAFGKQECGPTYEERDAQTRMIEHNMVADCDLNARKDGDV